MFISGEWNNMTIELLPLSEVMHMAGRAVWNNRHLETIVKKREFVGSSSTQDEIHRDIESYSGEVPDVFSNPVKFTVSRELETYFLGGKRLTTDEVSYRLTVEVHPTVIYDQKNSETGCLSVYNLYTRAKTQFETKDKRIKENSSGGRK